MEHGLCIVIADRGWVWVGDVTTTEDFVVIKGARCVRRWGTTRGLAELANNGPLSSTILDDPSDLKLATRALIGLIPCEAAKWTS